MKLSPPKKIKKAADLWGFYLRDSIQYEALMFETQRILDFLASPSTECFYIDRRPSWSVDYLNINITGQCYDGTKCIEVTLYRDEMTEAQKNEFKVHVLKAYPKGAKKGEEAKNFNVRKHVAKVLKIEPF